jgi:hypothetical protein
VTALIAGPATTPVDIGLSGWNWDSHPHLLVTGPADAATALVCGVVQRVNAADAGAAVVVDPTGRHPGAARTTAQITTAICRVHAEAARRYRSLWERTSTATPLLVLAIVGIDQVLHLTGSVAISDQLWGRQLDQLDVLGGLVNVHLAITGATTPAPWPRARARWLTLPAASASTPGPTASISIRGAR